MKEIKILHLFPKLLSLYGEYGNVAVLKKTLENSGISVTVDTYEDGPLELEGFDLVYVGAGTEDNLMEAIRRLLPHSAQIKASITSGIKYLATGNAMTLFGCAVERAGNKSAALDCFPYTTLLEDNKRYLGDVLTEDAFGRPLVGFVNTSSIYSDVPSPLLTLKLNPALGNDKRNCVDGIHVGNFYGTQLIGPMLVKNPHFLAHICQELTGSPITIAPDSNMEKAYQIALRELSARI